MSHLLDRLRRPRHTITFGLDPDNRRRAIWCCRCCGTTEHGPSLMDAETRAVDHNVLHHHQRLTIVGDHHLTPGTLR